MNYLSNKSNLLFVASHLSYITAFVLLFWEKVKLTATWRHRCCVFKLNPHLRPVCWWQVCSTYPPRLWHLLSRPCDFYSVKVCSIRHCCLRDCKAFILKVWERKATQWILGRILNVIVNRPVCCQSELWPWECQRKNAAVVPDTLHPGRCLLRVITSTRMLSAWLEANDLLSDRRELVLNYSISLYELLSPLVWK